MILTKKTRIVWATNADQVGNPQLENVRVETLYNMLVAEKTDDLPFIVSDTITERSWIDQAAADEYITMILTTTQQLGITQPNCIILDIV